MSYYAVPPGVSITHHNTTRTIKVPPNFFDGEWSVVAIALYFHLLMDEHGMSLWALCYRHPNIPEGEILNALYALEKHGFIEQDIVPCGEMGYVIAESCFEVEEGDE